VAKPIVNSVLDGFNGTIFAYGQSQAGKTYTMMGEDLEFSVKISMCQIHNEHVKDLYDP
jgi:hypothetical protein